MAAPRVQVHTPALQFHQIMQFFKGGAYNVPFNPDEIKNFNNFTADMIVDTMNVFVDLHMSPTRIECKQAPLSALQLLSYPELHEQSINEIEVYTNILQFCWGIGQSQASLKYLLYPEPRVTLELISASVNYTLFVSENSKLYAEFEARNIEMLELKDAADAEYTTLAPEIDKLTVSYARMAPTLKAREAELSEAKTNFSRAKKAAEAAQEESKAIKLEMAEITRELGAIKFQSSLMQQGNDILRKQIIKSPEKLRGRLAQMESEIDAKNREMEEAQTLLSTLNREDAVLAKVMNKLSKRATTVKECEEIKKKAKELHQDMKHKNAECQKEEEQLKDLKSSVQHFDKKITSTQEKLAILQKQGEQKRVQAQQALDETERQKRDLEFSIKQDKDQVKQNQAIIQRKEQEVQRLNQEHVREMDVLRTRYLQFANALRWYHSEILHATQVTQGCKQLAELSL